MNEITMSFAGGPKIQDVHIVGGVPKGYQQLTVNTVAQSLTIPTSANFAILSLENNSARYRDDGVAPTSSVGMPFTAGASYEIEDPIVLASFQIIQDINATGNPTLNISYYFKR